MQTEVAVDEVEVYVTDPMVRCRDRLYGHLQL